MLILDCYSSPGIVLLQMTHMTDVFYQYRFQVIFWQCVFKDHSQNHTLTFFPSVLCACSALGLRCLCSTAEFQNRPNKFLDSSPHFYWTKHKFGLLQFSSGTKWTIKIRPIQLCHAILFFFPEQWDSLWFSSSTLGALRKSIYSCTWKRNNVLFILLFASFADYCFFGSGGFVCLVGFALSFHSIVAIIKGY